MKILPNIEAMPIDRLAGFIKKRAEAVVAGTQNEMWDHPSILLDISVDLAHACYRLIKELESQGMIIKT
jgi:hypothetical protein